MSRRASPTAIGGFVVGSIALVVAGILTFGGGRFFEERATYVMYFDDSVTGLKQGAPVIFRGVEVGQVKEVSATIDDDLTIKIPVFIELVGNVIQPTSPELQALTEAERRRRNIPILIKRGLRAQLALQSLVTGQLHVSIDLHPEKEAVYHGDGTVPEIPTIPSPLSEVRERLQRLPLQKIATNMVSVLQSIDDFINSEELRRTVNNLDAALVAARNLANNVDSRVGPLSESATEAFAVLGEGSATRYALDNALVEMTAAARALRLLAEYLERHPDALISGKRGGS